MYVNVVRDNPKVAYAVFAPRIFALVAKEQLKAPFTAGVAVPMRTGTGEVTGALQARMAVTIDGVGTIRDSTVSVGATLSLITLNDSAIHINCITNIYCFILIIKRLHKVYTILQ